MAMSRFQSPIETAAIGYVGRVTPSVIASNVLPSIFFQSVIPADVAKIKSRSPSDSRSAASASLTAVTAAACGSTVRLRTPASEDSFFRIATPASPQATTSKSVSNQRFFPLPSLTIFRSPSLSRSFMGFLMSDKARSKSRSMSARRKLLKVPASCGDSINNVQAVAISRPRE